MANFFNLTLDTTGPASPTLSIESGASYAAQQLVTLTIGTTDGTTTGYQMLIWGDIDDTYDANIQTTEGASQWVTYETSKQVKLSTGDGAKTMYLKVRDDVYNVSSQVSDTITLDTNLPVVTISGPSVSKISKQNGKDTADLSFQCDSSFVEYKVKVVTAAGAAHDTGVQIGTANGSTGTSGTGSWTNASVVNVSIKGADLETASAGDGVKIVKVFVREASGNWSV